MIRIPVDFNATLDGKKIVIHDSVLPPNIELGTRVIIYEANQIEVEAIIELAFVVGRNIWYAVIDGPYRDIYIDIRNLEE